MLPATVNCPGLNATITAAIQSTTLGTAVSLTAVSLPTDPAEGYYCVNASNALIFQGNVSSPPTTCSTGVAPGDYLQVGVTYHINHYSQDSSA